MSVIPPPVPRPASTRASSGPSTALIVAAFIPLGFAILLALIAPGFYTPLLDDRVSLLGVPASVAFIAALLVLVAIDLIVAVSVRSSFVQGIVLALTTTAGVFLVILAPAFALIAINLGALDD